MIRNSFCILNGIGAHLEKRLWREKILTWEDFIGSRPDFISPRRKAAYDETLCRSLENLNAGNAAYFSTALKRSEHWRLFDVFGGEALYLDIETNGLQPGCGGYITMVGLYDGHDYRYLMHGENLTADNLRREAEGYKYLITFYGSVFDMPFIKRALGIEVDVPHFDICFGARRLGLKGGLKKLEASLGIDRPDELCGMDGYAAVLLWMQAERGNRKARELLVAYNREDTVNLMNIAGIVYKRLKESTGIGATGGHGPLSHPALKPFRHG